MKFTFKNLGPINNASLELGDLTLIAGLNNTGKSYIAYAIYGFLRELAERNEKGINEWLDVTRLSLGTKLPVENVVDQLFADKQVDIPMTKNDLDSSKINLVQQFSNVYSDQKLDNLFNDNTGSFEDSAVDVQVNTNPLHYIPSSFNLGETGKLSISHADDVLRITLVGHQPTSNDDHPQPNYRHVVEWWLTYMYAQFLLQDDFLFDFEVRCFTSVRPAISLFHKELESSRRLMVRSMQQDIKTRTDEQGNVWISADPIANASRYVLPINDEIDFVKSIPDDDHSPRTHSRHDELHKIEKMMRGHYEKYNERFYFVPSNKKGERSRIPLHLASSSVAELANLYFYFRNPNGHHSQLVIIDEPESHLDTANQIQLARLLARLVNSGLKVLITTHSDYIVKEINNLIMLNESFEGKEEVVENFEYKEGESLSP